MRQDRGNWILQVLWTAENVVHRLIVWTAIGAWVFVAWLLWSGN